MTIEESLEFESKLEELSELHACPVCGVCYESEDEVMEHLQSHKGLKKVLDTLSDDEYVPNGKSPSERLRDETRRKVLLRLSTERPDLLSRLKAENIEKMVTDELWRTYFRTPLPRESLMSMAEPFRTSELSEFQHQLSVGICPVCHSTGPFFKKELPTGFSKERQESMSAQEHLVFMRDIRKDPNHIKFSEYLAKLTMPIEELQRIEGYKRFTCPVCGAALPDLEKFKDHWILYHKQKYGEYTPAKTYQKMSKEELGKSDASRTDSTILEALTRE